MAKIKDLPKVDRPREKLMKYGPSRLSDTELLAIILGSGIKGLNVIQLSKKVLQLIQKIGVKKTTVEDLLSIKGLGKAKTLQISAMLELGKRLNTEHNLEIYSSEDVWKLCADIRSSKKEHFVAFFLNTQGHVLSREIISIGTLNASLVHPRELFEPAVLLHAASIIVAHNHPSGSLEPSQHDILVTERIKDAGILLGIPVENHVLLTENGHLSLK